jgi:hypothetical protein
MVMSGAMRRLPPCRDFGRDPRSRELAEQIVDRSRAIATLEGEQLADIAELDKAEGWRGDGAVSMTSWVTQQCGVGAGRARQWVRAASRLETLPKLAAGLASGSLTLDLVAPLAEVATAESDGNLAAEAKHLSVQQARELVVWHKAVREAEAQRRLGATWSAARDYDHRTLRFNDDRCTMWAAFTKEDYPEAKLALMAAMGWDEKTGSLGLEGGSRGGADPVGYVTLDQRLYDSLMDLFRVGSGGKSDGKSRRPTMVIHAPLELLVDGSGGGVAEIQGAGPISAEVARRLACDASITLSVERKDGCILDQGRLRKDPTAAQRIEIARRDKGCRFPGCSFKEFTHVHHVQHWIRDGETNMDNLITLCGRHHRAVHELGWKMGGNADARMTFTSPTGQRMTSVPSPTWRRQVPMRR